MPTQITNYQCPSCTGPLHFSGASGKLECEYCGSSYEVAQIEALYAQKEEKATAAFDRAEEKARQQAQEAPPGAEDGTLSGMRAYNCPSCGAELICDETTAATSCPYCGNPTVVPGQLSGVLQPDCIIPFTTSREDALEALKKHYKGKVLLPKSFKSENHIQKVQGVYVPFWLFDGVAEADVDYKATRTQVRRTANEEITVTEHFQVRRAGSVAFEKVPVDASKKMSDDHMDSIEPYDYGALTDFSTAYLPGFLAEKYDVSAEESAKRAEDRCRASVLAALRQTVTDYDSVNAIREDVQIHRGQVRYALMPVWLLNTKWKGKDFLFAMNGQTGRVAGDLPVSWAKFWAIFAAIAFGLSLLATGCMCFL